MGQSNTFSQAPIGVVSRSTSKRNSLSSTSGNDLGCDSNNFIYLSTENFSYITKSKSIEDNYIKETIISQNAKMKTKTYRLTHRFTKEPKLLDQISLDNLSEEYQDQVNLLIGLDHPNILKIFGTYKTNDTFNVIKDYTTSYTLHQVVEDNGEFIEKAAANIIYQILLALHYLKQFDIIPINVCSNSFFVEKQNNVNYSVKLHNIYQKVPENEIKNINSNEMLKAYNDSFPPEYFTNEQITEKSPSYCTGLILYELLTGSKPITPNLKKINLSEPFITQTSKACQQLLFDLLRRDPKSRISVSDALQSKWFKEFETKRMLNYISDEAVIRDLVHNLKSYRRKSVIQETAVSYLIHHLSRNDDIINATKLFRIFDKNNEGTISQDELLGGLDIIYNQNNFTKEDAAVLFSNVDKNNNGMIELKEFLCAAVNRKVFLTDDAIQFCFNYFDLDGNGTITIDEIETLFKDAILSNGNEDEKNKSIRSIIKEVDINFNGEISFKKFKLAMQNLLCK